MDCKSLKENTSFGPAVISLEVPTSAKMKNISTWLTEGGEFTPTCGNPDTVAIIVPYRQREEQLSVFLAHIHPFIMKQGFIHYRIYIVNQVDSLDFNRASLMNVGFLEALRDFDWSCFIFHDVDHLPEDARNFYSCTENPRLMAAAVDRWNYEMLYPTYFGGVVSMKKEQYQKINGASNKFWGWGGEDDDLRNRIIKSGMRPTIGDRNVSRYSTIRHEPEEKNPNREKVLREGIGRLENKTFLLLEDQIIFRFETDGLNSLNYKIHSISYHNLYTNVSVELNKTEMFYQLFRFNCLFDFFKPNSKVVK